MLRFTRIFIGVLLFWACGLARAELLEDVQRQLTLAPVIRGEFLQTRQLAQIKKPLLARGQFLVATNLGVIWENTQPFTQVTRLTRNEILQTDGETTLMKISADKEPAVKIINGILFSVFSGDVAALAQTFEYNGEAAPKGWRLHFVPRDKNLARLIRELRLEGGTAITRVEMESAAGDVTRIEFTAQSYAESLTETEKKRFE
jgi:hypothetical protein